MNERSHDWLEFVRSAATGLAADAVRKRFTEGGHLTVAASHGLAMDRTLLIADEVGIPTSVVDLDGWEPDAESLERYATYLQARRGFDEIPPQARSAAGAGALDAARLSLAMGSREDDTFAAHDLRDALANMAGRGRVLLVPDGDILPMNVRQVLQDTCTPGSGFLWLDVHPTSTEDADVRIEIDSGNFPAASREAFQELEEDFGSDVLARALRLWSAVDRPWPVEPVLAFLGLDEDARETAVDQIDDAFVEGAGLVQDLQFLHPSFQQAVYGPNGGFRHFVLSGQEAPDADEAARLADELRLRLRPRRGSFIVLHRLALLAGDEHEAQALSRRLRWWIEPDGLEQVVERALQDGDTSADELWQGAADPFAPPGHRLVFLAAWAKTDEGSQPAEQGRRLMLEAEILHRLQRLPEALEVAQRCLEIQGLNHGTESSPYLGALHQTASLLLDLERPEEALKLFELCVATARKVLPADDPKQVLILENHGRALARGGRLREARARLEEALEELKVQRGPSYVGVAVSRNNLAGLLLEMGELELAVEHLEAAAADFEKHFGPRSMELYGALRNLAKANDDLGRHHQAEGLLQRVADLEEAMLGPSHPTLVATWARLAELKRENGDPKEAHFLFSRALELALEVLYEDHPSVPLLRQSLESLDVEGD